ncbi:hypothetical protein [Nocardia africana]
MTYTVLKTSSIVEPEVYVCDDYQEAARLLDGIRDVMAAGGIPAITDTPDHCMFRADTGHTWAATIVERAQLSPYWKNREVAA